MKKLIFILAFAIVAIAAKSQTATFKFKDYTIVTKTTDYTLTNTTTSWFRIKGAKDVPSTQDFQCNLDSASGDHTNVAVSLWGRKFSDDSWTQIGSTVNWAGVTSDTTFTISNTAPIRYREFKHNFVGTGTGTTTIDYQYLKLWLE